MAKRKRLKRKRRMVRKRRRRSRRIPVLLGKSHVCSHKLVVANQLLVDSVAGLSITQTIRANSAAIPVVGSGVQPNGFAQMSAMFNKSTVLGCKMTLTVLPSTGQHSRAIYIEKTLVNRFGTPSFVLNEILARRYTRYCVISSGPGTGWKPRVTQTCSPKKFLGLKDIRDNDEVSALGDSLPEKEIFFNYAMAPTHSTEMQTIDVIAQVSYVVLYTDPITPPFT